MSVIRLAVLLVVIGGVALLAGLTAQFGWPVAAIVGGASLVVLGFLIDEAPPKAEPKQRMMSTVGPADITRRKVDAG